MGSRDVECQNGPRHELVLLARAGSVGVDLQPPPPSRGGTIAGHAGSRPLATSAIASIAGSTGCRPVTTVPAKSRRRRAR
eukprot:11211100-Lingulodinium_polyedra.AAC.1